jgi:hypothetical protein
MAQRGETRVKGRRVMRKQLIECLTRLDAELSDSPPQTAKLLKGRGSESR